MIAPDWNWVSEMKLNIIVTDFVNWSSQGGHRHLVSARYVSDASNVPSQGRIFISGYRKPMPGDCLDVEGEWRQRDNSYTRKVEFAFNAHTAHVAPPTHPQLARLLMEKGVAFRQNPFMRWYLGKFADGMSSPEQLFLDAWEMDYASFAAYRGPQEKVPESEFYNQLQLAGRYYLLSLLRKHEMEDYMRDKFSRLIMGGGPPTRIRAFAKAPYDMVIDRGVSIPLFRDVIESFRQESPLSGGYLDAAFLGAMLQTAETLSGSTAFSLKDLQEKSPSVTRAVFEAGIASDNPFLSTIQNGKDVLLTSATEFRGMQTGMESFGQFLCRSKPLCTDGKEITRILGQKKYARMDPVQRLAAALPLYEKFSIITGGPGVGKTTCLEAAAELLEAQGMDVVFMAPFGKAARVIQNRINRPADTIHGTMGARRFGNETTFKINNHNPFSNRTAIVVDETSTLDEEMFMNVLKALAPQNERTRLVFVGDPKQLPSVGAGAVLRDLLLCGFVPHIQLKKIYRSGDDSGIAEGAQEIDLGRLPAFRNGASFVEADDDDVSANVAIQVRRLLDAGCSQSDICVISPQAPGPGGTHEMNAALGKIFNPDGAYIVGTTRTRTEEKDNVPIPRIGDRVMATVTNKKRGFINGDFGVVTRPTKSDRGEPGFEVAFDNGEVVSFIADDWRDFILTYAMTIHRYQGSQATHVVMAISTRHQNMLDRPMVYTGWTRAEKSVTMVGSLKALRRGIERETLHTRETMLKYALATLRPMVLTASLKQRMKAWEKELEARQMALDSGAAPGSDIPDIPMDSEGTMPAATSSFGIRRGSRGPFGSLFAPRAQAGAQPAPGPGPDAATHPAEARHEAPPSGPEPASQSVGKGMFSSFGRRQNGGAAVSRQTEDQPTNESVRGPIRPFSSFGRRPLPISSTVPNLNQQADDSVDDEVDLDAEEGRRMSP